MLFRLRQIQRYLYGTSGFTRIYIKIYDLKTMYMKSIIIETRKRKKKTKTKDDDDNKRESIIMMIFFSYTIRKSTIFPDR